MARNQRNFGEALNYYQESLVASESVMGIKSDLVAIASMCNLGLIQFIIISYGSFVSKIGLQERIP
jgi:hypothetical protein